LVTLDKKLEDKRLEAIAADSWYARGANGASVRYLATILERYLRGTRCLELGPAEGLLTEALVRFFPEVTLVDGSRQFCDALRLQFPRSEIVHSLFEDFVPHGRYDAIVLGHVLEHINDSASLLASARSWLNDGGAVYAAVPNARSIHRQAAVMMSLLPTEHSLNESDNHHGHRRVYDPESFRAEFLQVGFKIKVFGGYWLKPLSNAQIDSSWTPEMLQAFMPANRLSARLTPSSVAGIRTVVFCVESGSK
jgi:2-polyprenyl-3-methyl-5-hydroxy-6-metoxy-1,4-benzoquinol methylase